MLKHIKKNDLDKHYKSLNTINKAFHGSMSSMYVFKNKSRPFFFLRMSELSDSCLIQLLGYLSWIHFNTILNKYT